MFTGHFCSLFYAPTYSTHSTCITRILVLVGVATLISNTGVASSAAISSPEAHTGLSLDDRTGVPRVGGHDAAIERFDVRGFQQEGRHE